MQLVCFASQSGRMLKAAVVGTFLLEPGVVNAIYKMSNSRSIVIRAEHRITGPPKPTCTGIHIRLPKQVLVPVKVEPCGTGLRPLSVNDITERSKERACKANCFLDIKDGAAGRRCEELQMVAAFRRVRPQRRKLSSLAAVKRRQNLQRMSKRDPCLCSAGRRRKVSRHQQLSLSIRKRRKRPA